MATATKRPRRKDAERQPGTRNPEATKSAVLAAAIREFAERGVGGARVAAIAEASGYSKRMIYHYFGSREELFIAALESIYSDFRQKEGSLSLAELDPVEGMETLVRYGWQHLNAHPEFISLLNSENLNKAKYLKQSRVVKQLQTPLLDTIDDLLARGVKQGVFREDVDRKQLYITLSALSYFYLSNIHTLSTIFSTDFSRADEKSQREDHIVQVMLGFLRYGSKQTPPARGPAKR